MAVETSSLMRLPDYLTPVDGAILACQAGTAYWPLVRLAVNGRHLVAVSGLGPLGLLATLFATAMGARVAGIDPSAGRRQLAEKLGATLTLDPTTGPVHEQLHAAYPDGADALIETSGANAAQSSRVGSSTPERPASCTRTRSSDGWRRSTPRTMSPSKFSSATNFSTTG